MKKMENQKRWKFGLAAFLLVACGIFVYRAGMVKGASGQVPGSASDPLVTKSYLEQRLGEASGSVFRKVSLSKGESVLLAFGSEAVLFSGNAEVTGNDGLINLTAGELFKKGNSMVRYHSYLSPAGSSGLTASGNVVLFIRGDYTKK